MNQTGSTTHAPMHAHISRKSQMRSPRGASLPFFEGTYIYHCASREHHDSVVVCCCVHIIIHILWYIIIIILLMYYWNTRHFSDVGDTQKA
jgi:hypothetical protein